VKLIIGNKNYSSWSLRAWLLLSANDIPFEEIRIPLFTATTHQALSEYTAVGKVPVLLDHGRVVWDSLAICETISENHLAGRGWPSDSHARAEARSCCAEMHSGFFAIREHMPMNCRAQNRRINQTPALDTEISRLDHMWSGLREKYNSDGPWLFGDFSIADCFFAPMVFRFNTYGVALSQRSQDYIEQILSHPKVMLWLAQARNETETIDRAELGYV